MIRADSGEHHVPASAGLPVFKGDTRPARRPPRAPGVKIAPEAGNGAKTRPKPPFPGVKYFPPSRKPP